MYDISQIVYIYYAGLYMPVFSARISQSHGSFDDSKPSNDHQCLRDFLRHLAALVPSVHTNNISDSLKMLTIVSTRVWRVFMHCSVRSGNGVCHSRGHCLNCYFPYNDVIISAMAPQITGISIACWTVGSGADQRKLPRHWPLCGEFTGDGWIPVQTASNAKNVSIWWRHRVPGAILLSRCISYF